MALGRPFQRVAPDDGPLGQHWRAGRRVEWERLWEGQGRLPGVVGPGYVPALPSRPDGRLTAPLTHGPADGQWRQIGGDMTPESHGALLARADRHGVDVVRIENLRDHVGDDEAASTKGRGLFLADSWSFDWDDLDMDSDPAMWRRICSDYEGHMPEGWTLEDCGDNMDASWRAERLAEDHSPGEVDSGTSEDVLPAPAEEIVWWGDAQSVSQGFAEEDDWLAGAQIRLPRAERQKEEDGRLPPSVEDERDGWLRSLPLRLPWNFEARRRLGL